MSEALRVVIDARYWRASIQTGVERYIHLLTEAIAAAPHPVEAAVLLTTPQAAGYTPHGNGRNIRILTVPDRRETHLHRALDSFRADVVHYPFALPARLYHPAVFTLHDAGRYMLPEQMVRAVREVQSPRLLELLADPLLRCVVTVSESSRADIEAALGPLPVPLAVVPNYVSAALARRLRHPDRSLAPAESFLFGIGVYMPSKNIPRLCRAFRLARAQAPDLVPPRLLLAGRRGWERGLPSRSNPEIAMLGHVDEACLAALFAATFAFVFAPLFEGFGIPPQEALVAGCRLLCSDLPVLREVTAGLATFADPRDDAALAKGIIEACDSQPADPAAVSRLMATYSAPAAGTRLVDVYRHAALDSR